MLSSNTSAVSGDANYIEDVFSTYLYSATGATQTITNNIDLSTKGGLVFFKTRTFTGAGAFIDTARGAGHILRTNSTNADAYDTDTQQTLTSFNSNGFTLGADAGSYGINSSGLQNVSSWTFRKQAKFFDVVTWTGNGGSGNRQIAHSLGSVPGFITMKNTSSASSWPSYHRSLGANFSVDLNSTGASGASSYYPATPTSTYFEINAGGSFNTSGQTYVAYIFAHDAGGFGLTGTDNVISCGSYTGTGTTTGPTVTLGYEPQWLMVKNTTGTGNWQMIDVMRGFSLGYRAHLSANLTSVESTSTTVIAVPTATGFSIVNTGTDWNTSGSTYIYIAIRRGPMKVPTDATKVFKPVARAGTSAVASVTGLGFVPDSALIKNRLGNADSVDWSFNFFDKLRSPGYRLSTAFTNAEDTSVNFITTFNEDGITFPSTGYTATNGSDYTYINYFFQRAPSFFDEVCYTGTGSARTVSHNLAAVPELMIVKSRSAAGYWPVYSASIGNDYILSLDTTAAKDGPGAPQWNSTTPTSSVFSLGASSGANANGTTFVAYLFATCAGVSKVGSYTGTGTTKQVDCGFAAGARFVLIKRTDSTGAWYVWDTARGIISGNDPYLLINSTAAEVTNTDYVDTYSAGFELSSTAPAAINASGGTYIFLAIA